MKTSLKISALSLILCLAMPFGLSAESAKKVVKKVAAAVRNAAAPECCAKSECCAQCNAMDCAGGKCKCGCSQPKPTKNGSSEECVKCACSKPKPTKGDEEVCVKCGCQKPKPTKDGDAQECVKCACQKPKPTK